MGFSNGKNDTAMTPGRTTKCVLDPPQNVLTFPAVGLHRDGSEIARGGTDNLGSQAVYQLSTGAWQLMSVQVNRGNYAERSDTPNGIIPLSQMTVAPNVQQLPRNKKDASLVGVNYAADYATTGNLMLREFPTGSGPFSSTLAADVAAFPTPATSGQLGGNVQVDRKAVTAPLPADQPISFTIEVPGTHVGSPDVVSAVTFGGPANKNGQGQFCLTLQGDGYAVLSEQNSAPPPGVLALSNWIDVDRFAYCAPNEVAGAHTVTIIPGRNNVGGAWIDFIIGRAGTSGGGLVQVGGYHTSQTNLTRHCYIIFDFQNPALPVRTNVTGMGPLRVDVRQDIRPWFAPSTLKYLSPGRLVDYPLAVEMSGASTPNLTLTWDAIVPAGTSLTGAVYDVDTNTPCTVVATTSNSVTVTLNPNQPFYFMVFTFTTDSTASFTPQLNSYTAGVDAVYSPSPGTPFVIPDDGGILSGAVSFTSGEKDPTHESGSFMVRDPWGIVPRLGNRANIPFKFLTYYDPNDATKYSVIGSGAITRANKKPKGRKRNGRGFAGHPFAGAPHDVQYPAPGWADYSCLSIGEWIRLMKAKTFVRFNVAVSRDVNPDNPSLFLPFKVTDVVRLFLGWAGYAPDEIDVPDNPTRFFVSTSVPSSSFIVEPLVSVGDWIVKTLRDYLGWFLIRDENAGTNGMWRVRPPTYANPDGTYNPLAAFVTGGPANKGVLKSASYGNKADTVSPGPYVGDGTFTVTAPILRRGGESTLETYVKPPENNAVIVTGTGQLLSNGAGQKRNTQYAINVMAYNVPGASLATPDNTDYTGGYFDPLVVVDPALGLAQYAVDALTRRYYDVTTHSIKMATFEAPLVLIVDPTDPYQSRPRPLRYYDPVTITDSNGTLAYWLVRNVTIKYQKTAFQTAIYECEAPREIS